MLNRLETVTRESLKQETIDRYFPAQFFIEQNDKSGLELAIRNSIDRFNELVYMPRAVEAPAGERITLPADVETILRVEFNHQVMQSQGLYGPDAMPLSFQSQVSGFINENLMMRSTQISMMKRSANVGPRFKAVDGTLFLHDIPTGATKAVVYYTPRFDREGTTFPLYAREARWLRDYIFYLALQREGRLLQFNKYLDLDTPASDLLDEANENLEKLEEMMKNRAIFSMLRS